MKRITLLVALLVCSFGFAQQTTLATSPTQIVEVQEPTNNQITNSNRSVVIDYTLDQTGTFAPIDISVSGTDVALGDDDGTGPIPMGFTFTFIGNDYTDIYISSNGYLTFDPADVTDLSDDAIPDANMPNDIIAVAWDDLDPGNGGQPAINVVRYSIEGISPNQIFVVEYFNVDQFPSGNNVTTQAQLYEGTNVIEIHTTMKPSDGGPSTQGIENFDGSDGLAVPGRNNEIWDITNDFVSFTPNSGGGPNTWTVLVEDLSGNFGDEVTWELRDNTTAVILSGGPYAPNYSDMQMVTTSNEPLEFFISASVGGFDDNTPNYTVSCGGNVIVSGALVGGDTATHSGLLCAPAGPMCNINYANVIGGINGAPSQIFPDLLGQGISADDFVIPLLPSQAAAICDISVTGVYTAGGPAADPNSAITLNIYTDAAGTPDNLIFTEDFDPATVDPGNVGSFTLTPTGTINLIGGTTYYASVVITMEFGLSGQWFWLSATDGNDGEMQWEDTDNLFGTGCTTWMPGSACGINGGDPDLQMDINFMMVPTFDECAGAIAMSCGDVETGDTTTNTDTGGFNGAPDAWYSYTGTGAQEFVTFSLCDGGTTYDSRLTLYDACGAVELQTNDDSCGLQSELGFLSDGTTTYYVAVEGFNAASSGPYSLEMTCNPVAANDDCANAEAVNCGDVVAGSTSFATFDGTAMDCGVGITAPGVWYTFSDATGLLTDYSVDLCDGGTTYDSKLTVYVGDDCGTLTCIGDNDDDCGLQSTVSWQSADVATYFVLVHGFGAATGNFSLSINCDGVPPPNDMIANSIDVDEIGYPYTDPNVSLPFATTEAGTPVDCDNAGALGVWYNFTPLGNGSATATITSPAGPSSVTFYTAPSESAVETDLVHIDYFLNQCVDSVEATILTGAGQAYYVYVYNHGGASDVVIDGIGLGTIENTIEGFGFYPNPAKDMLTLNSADTIESVEIFSIVGQQVMNQAINATSKELNVSALSTGTYLMKVIVNGQVGVYKVIKE